MALKWADDALRAHRQAQAVKEVRRRIDEKVTVDAAAKVFNDHEPRVERVLRAVLTAQRQATRDEAGAREARQAVDGALDWIRKRSGERRWSKDQHSRLDDAWQAAKQATDAHAAGTERDGDADPWIALLAYTGWLRDVRQQVRAAEAERTTNSTTAVAAGGRSR